MELSSTLETLKIRLRELGYSCELNPGCTKSRIDWLSSKIGIVLPDSLSSLLQCADGETFESAGFGAFGFDCRFLDASEIDSTIQRIKDVQAFFGEIELETIGPVKSLYWNPRWIPFIASTYVGYFVDLDPDEGGVVGQVLRAEVEEGLLSVESESIHAFLDDFASGKRALPQRADA